MNIFQESAVAQGLRPGQIQPPAIAWVLLVVLMGLVGCEPAPRPDADGHNQTQALPVSSDSVKAALGAVSAEPVASESAGTTSAPREISHPFKVKTTDAARAAVEAVEAAGKKAEQAVDESTR